MNDRRTVLVLTRAAIKVALRTPQGLVFTAALPLVLLLFVNSVLIHGSGVNTLPSGLQLSAHAAFTAGIIAYSVATSTFTTLAVSLTTQRERGQLKRYRGTPMPPWTFFVAQIMRATVQALLITALMLIVAAIAYGIPIPGSTFPAFVLYVILGTATFCSLGIALSAFAPTVDTATPIASFSLLILGFVSGVWVPIENLPHGLEILGKVFPLYHLALGLQTTLSPSATGSGLEFENLLILAIWAVAGVRIASRRFRWEPLAATGGG